MRAGDPEVRSREERLASDAVRSLTPPLAEAAYRARLKDDFASGALAAAGARRGPVRLPVPFWRNAAFRWMALPAAAAAGLIVAGALNRGPGWELVSSRGEGEALVDGVPVPIGRTPDLERRLRRGVRVQLPQTGEIEIALRGQMVMQVTPGTDVTLPAAAGRWFGRNTRAGVSRGELRITTGAGFRGARLEVETPEAMVEVTGTTLAVICEPTGTCVCVLEGRVSVAAQAEGSGVEVTEGRRRYVFNDARPPETADIRPNEIGLLREFRAAKREMMGR